MTADFMVKTLNKVLNYS